MFGIGSDLTFWQGDQATFESVVLWWLCCFRACGFFSSAPIVISSTVSALEDVTLSGAITLLTQGGNFKASSCFV